MPAEAQHCPICGRDVQPSARYPHHLCTSCAARAVSPDGRPLRLANRSLSGGYAAHYADTGEPYERHDCLVDGISCRADEARFGGIVIETVAG